MSDEKCLHFTIEGEYITNVAREKLFVEKDLAGAIRILRSSLCSDEISSDEQLMLCLQILHGAASIKGRSGTDDYGVVVRDDTEECPTNLSSIAQLISDLAAENKRLNDEKQELLSKISFLAEQFPNYKLMNVNENYYAETGEPLFSDMEIPYWAKQSDSTDTMLESFLEQRRREDMAIKKGEELECDYGWLEPDGTWHPVEWGLHSEWAATWLDEHMPFAENPKIYWRIDAAGNRHHITNGDVLVFSLGWILLDSPWKGLAKPTSDPSREMTKAQKEFLYDYFTKRKRNDEANAIYGN